MALGPRRLPPSGFGINAGVEKLNRRVELSEHAKRQDSGDKSKPP
jgi:hypothetical protein